MGGNLSKAIDKFVGLLLCSIISIVIFLILIALFSTENEHEPSIGTFDAKVMNNNWTMYFKDEISQVTLPLAVDAKKGDEIVISNKLPNNIPDDGSIMIRSAMQDVYIFVNGELRAEYSSDSIDGHPYYLPSAYVVAPINANDQGADIQILIRVKSKGQINEVRVGAGDNVWYRIINNNLPVNLCACLVFVFALIMIMVFSLLPGKFSDNNGAFNLGLLMEFVALWIFAESNLRQILFSRPSLSQYFSYLICGLLGILGARYFDEIQNRRYHKYYITVQLLALLQLFVNIFLRFTNIMEFYETLIFSNIWSIAAIVVSVTCLCMDIKSGNIREYRITAAGFAFFLLSACGELIGFYFTRKHVFGVFICLGLIVLMGATIMQSMITLMLDSKEREKKKTQMIVNTIETIASAIDAKDEYTGGHSERVGSYATILAREMAADYDLSEEDIMRIHYIGLMHDIGKIGVADTVLNKAGRLTDEEFSLMKKHVDIGYELMASMEESVEGLLDGIKYHHERFDGNGYPDGLKGTEIPLVARILCIADCYDAMTSNRVYRKRLSDEEVRAELKRCLGTQFDPALTQIFISLMDRGALTPDTKDGMALRADGNVAKAALLENRLQKDELKDKSIVKFPTHVRMLCYICKLKEKKGDRVSILFVGPKNEDEAGNRSELWEVIDKNIKAAIERHDVYIEYSRDVNVIVLFNRSREQLDALKERIGNGAKGVFIEELKRKD